MEKTKDGTGVALSTANPMLQVDAGVQNEMIKTVKELFHKPSPHMKISDMLELKRSIEKESKELDVDGVVVTHGTDTLEETAYLLDVTLQTDIPVILTGAMRSSNEVGADGLGNLISALRVAAHDESAGKGVLVVMNEEIHAARYVTKTHTSNVASFQSPMTGPAGAVHGEDISFYYSPAPQSILPANQLGRRVLLLKTYAGMEADMLLAADKLGYDGAVIEAFGQGNVPPDVADACETLIKKGISVVLTSRCLQGEARPTYDYPGGGKRLQQSGVIFCKDLNGQKARIKLLAALEYAARPEEIRKYF